MNHSEYRAWAQRAADWAADYRAGIAELPVRSPAAPGDTLAALPATAPEEAEEFATIFHDFERLVPPGLTHWQHPRFFAYFPANASLPSVLAEQLTAAIGAQCMLWQTSPVATEMEIRMLQWLADMCQLPPDWRGVIQDSASSATLAAVVTARERALDWRGREHGLAGAPRLRFYGAQHCHSSAAKALWIAGIGAKNLVEVATDASGGMAPGALRAAVGADRAAGHLPAGVLAVVGATSTGVADNLRAIGEVCQAEGLYCHVDAAWAGSAMICPEHRHLIDGLELADSYVFNPHKWLGANFDVAAHYVRDHQDLIRTMATNPDYLQTMHAADMPDFCHWSVPLGRRFRALKLWFVLRAQGIANLRAMIRDHVSWAAQAAATLDGQPDFELLAGPHLALFVFRHRPRGKDAASLNAHNARLLEAINADGFCYLTQTTVAGKYALRFQVGQTDTTAEHVREAITHITKLAAQVAAAA